MIAASDHTAPPFEVEARLDLPAGPQLKAGVIAARVITVELCAAELNRRAEGVGELG